MQKLIVAGGAMAALLLALMLLGYFAQRAVMFPAPVSSPGQPRRGAELVSLQLPAGVVEAFLLPAAAGSAAPAPMLIFTHGNGELAEYWIDEFDEPRSWGWSVLLVEYPGYGQSAGKPSEQSIRAAVLAAYDWAVADARIDRARIVPYGRSLGGGAAAILAKERSVAALILESSFTSVRPLAARFLLPGPLVRDPFDNLQALRNYRGPLLVLHGVEDEIIPVSHGRALAAAVPGAELRELPCGHNDCPRPWPHIARFLATHRLPERPPG